MKKDLNSTAIKKILKDAQKHLSGHWLLLGGSLLQALDFDIRTTTDIDMVSLDGDRLENDLKLMELAQSHGLPIEAINQAAYFFLQKVKGFEKMLIPIHQSKKLTLSRPNLELYLTLKINRLTESDLLDCLAYIDFCQEKDDVSIPPILKRIKLLNKPNISKEKQVRILKILSKLK